MTANKAGPAVGEWAMAAGIAVVAALAAVYALSALAEPSQMKARLAAVEADIETARQLFRKRSVDGVQADALCRGAPVVAAPRLKSEITALTAGAGVQKGMVDVRPDPQGSGEPDLVALRLSIAGEGSYEAVLALLSQLSAVRPAVFIDTVDLESATSSIRLSISGRVYCSAVS